MASFLPLPETPSASPCLTERASFPAAGEYTLCFYHGPEHLVCDWGGHWGKIFGEETHPHLQVLLNAEHCCPCCAHPCGSGSLELFEAAPFQVHDGRRELWLCWAKVSVPACGCRVQTHWLAQGYAAGVSCPSCPCAQCKQLVKAGACLWSVQSHSVQCE